MYPDACGLCAKPVDASPVKPHVGTGRPNSLSQLPSAAKPATAATSAAAATPAAAAAPTSGWGASASIGGVALLAAALLMARRRAASDAAPLSAEEEMPFEPATYPSAYHQSSAAAPRGEDAAPGQATVYVPL